MKIKILFIFIFSIFILTGCFSPVAVQIVEDMYTKALVEEDEKVTAYFSEEFLAENPIDSLSDELAEQVRNVEGIKLLNIVEVKRDSLHPDIVRELDEAYDDEWFYIVLDAGENHIMTWVVLKKSTHYEIVDGEKMTVDAYNENVLK